jgi:hypothetical protein
MTEYNCQCGSQIRSCFEVSFGIPPIRVLFEDAGAGACAGAIDLLSSPSKMMKLESGSSAISCGPPEAPRKPRKKTDVLVPIEGLSVLPNDFYINRLKCIGKGSYGEVFSVKLGNFGIPESPSFAMKVISVIPGGRTSTNDLRYEAKNFGSPKCVPGVGMSSTDGKTYYGFSPITVPLDKLPITSENIEKVYDLTRDAVMKGPFSVAADACPENMGFLSAGTPTPVLGENRLPCAGSPVENDEVVFIDLGNAEPNDCNPKYGALFDEGAMKSDEAKLKYRRFKCDMMSALLRNRLLAEPRNEYDIVRKICKSKLYGYTYAAGDRR